MDGPGPARNWRGASGIIKDKEISVSEVVRQRSGTRGDNKSERRGAVVLIRQITAHNDDGKREAFNEVLPSCRCSFSVSQL